MIDENIDERKLNDMVSVLLVYGKSQIDPKIDDDAKSGKDERVLDQWQKQWPNPKGDLKGSVIKVINKHGLDVIYNKILEKIPKAIDLSKEYFVRED
jgi:hypothetical protein